MSTYYPQGSRHEFFRQGRAVKNCQNICGRFSEILMISPECFRLVQWLLFVCDNTPGTKQQQHENLITTGLQPWTDRRGSSGRPGPPRGSCGRSPPAPRWVAGPRSGRPHPRCLPAQQRLTEQTPPQSHSFPGGTLTGSWRGHFK